jgi:pimeloyl-ACP methyl ester carboxylesterase
MGSFDVDTLPLQDLRMPVVLLASGRDRLLPSVDEANRLAERLPYSHVEILPYSGHACLLEQDLDLRVVLEKHQMLGSLHETIAEASCRKPDF